MTTPRSKPSFKSAFEHARRKARKPLQLKRLEGPFHVEGAAYGGLVACAVRVDDYDYIVLAESVDALVELWGCLNVNPDDVKVHAKRVALVESRKVKRP